MGDVDVIETSFIPVADGVRLAVKLWIPEDAASRPAPAVLEYIPYRKRDGYRAYDHFWGQSLASRGIAYARLETRGSGDSTGVLDDEYLPSEQQDAVAAIAWLAAQAWCNGNIGMRGVSWGGFSCLQAAALQPPALKAIMPMCASDMRFTDDAHYVGGAFALTGLKWAASMKVVMAGPPDPLISGEDWESEWRRRLDATAPIAARWLSHQSNDPYWRQGSVGVDYDAIRCPTYVVGGLVDPYGAAVPRLLTNLNVPRKAIYGPWQHGYPTHATPGPALDWADEEAGWWRHWLVGADPGVMRTPMLRVYMPDATAAQVSPGPIPGRWVEEAQWPSARVRQRPFFLAKGGLHAEPQSAEIARCASAPVVGLGKVEWVPFAPTELPLEQAPDDARSLVFDSQILPDRVEILGMSALRVRVSADRAIAHLAIRLCEVTPDGRSWLVSWGLLNLTHRDGHDSPAPLEPGRPYDVEVPLAFTAHAFQAGSRIRAAISESLWPLVWPSPRPVTLTLDLGAAELRLPVRESSQDDDAMPIPLAAPPAPDPKGWPEMRIVKENGRIEVSETWPDSSRVIVDTGETVTGSGPDISLSMSEGDPSSCVWRAWRTAGYGRPDWAVTLRSEVAVSATPETFDVAERLTATLNGDVVADIPHRTQVARALM
jgi:putative CocE/NonD family hydrolase